MVPNRLPSAIVVISAHWEEMVPTVKIISTLLLPFYPLFFFSFFFFFIIILLMSLN